MPFGRTNERKGIGELRRFFVKLFSSKKFAGVRGPVPAHGDEALAYGANKNKGGEIQSDLN